MESQGRRNLPDYRALKRDEVPLKNYLPLSFARRGGLRG